MARFTSFTHLLWILFALVSNNENSLFGQTAVPKKAQSQKAVAKQQPAQPRRNRIPTPDFLVTAGSRLTTPDEVLGAIRTYDYLEHCKLTTANDQDGLIEMIKSNKLFKIEKNAFILILKTYLYEDNSIYGVNYPVEIRVLTGQAKGLALLVKHEKVVPLIPAYFTGERTTIVADHVIAAEFPETFVPGQQTFQIEKRAKIDILKDEGRYVKVRLVSNSKHVSRVGYVPRSALAPIEMIEQ